MLRDTSKYAIVLVMAILCGGAGCQKKICSRLGDSDSVGIINGQLADESDQQARSVVGLAINAGGKLAICTGSLLNGQQVLTAAHCVKDAEKIRIIFSNDMTSAAPTQIRDGGSPRIHSRADLAIVSFAGGLPSGYHPVRLPSEEFQASSNEKMLLMGYGVTGPHQGAGILRKTYSHGVKKVGAFLVTDTRESGVCFGDSGGPAFLRIRGNWTQVGVAHATSTENCKEAAAHVDLSEYLDWLNGTSDTHRRQADEDFNSEDTTPVCEAESR